MMSNSFDRSPIESRQKNGVAKGGGSFHDMEAKIQFVSGIATHSAASFNPAGLLRPGERAVVACIACDRDQGKIIWRYIHSYFQQIPPLAAMVERVAESDGIIELSNQVDIVVLTGSHRALRGRPILLAILDEVAFYRDENSSTPDTELYNAVLSGLSTIPQSMIIGISSPYKSDLVFYSIVGVNTSVRTVMMSW